MRRMIVGLVGLLFVLLVAQRIHRYATFEPQAFRMPSQLINAEERELFGSPGGAYSPADIASNGSQLPAERYRGFRAAHEIRPRPGDQLCPITQTKAHPECIWVIGGRTYAFCCPPCIAEFVRHAKEQPELIRPPESYVMRQD